tara:strand:- start:1611 stop:1967 length:357 start_codon:yes stop_codon:yes gene_type:complete
MFKLITILIIFFIVLIYNFSLNKKRKSSKRIIAFKNINSDPKRFLDKYFEIHKNKLILNPDLNIAINNLPEVQSLDLINIHRSRLSKFKKSKLNNQMIYLDEDGTIYTVNNEGVKTTR